MSGPPGPEGRRASHRQFFCFTLGMLALLLAVTWPLGDLAAHWSLLALVVQRLLLMLAVPAAAGHRHPAAPSRRAHPTGHRSMPCCGSPSGRCPPSSSSPSSPSGPSPPPPSAWATSSASARVVFQLIVLLAGFVLWAPVLTHLPGTRHLSALARGGYLIVQSIVPSFLSVVWIFARRPLYPAYSHATVAGMSPVLDQQLAGFAAKLSTIAVLWTVAFIIMSRAKVMDGDRGGDRTADLVRRRTGDRAGGPARPLGEVDAAVGQDNRLMRYGHAPAVPGAAQPERWSGERGSPEILQRKLGRLIAAALRAVLDVSPAAQEAAALGVQEHDERFGDRVDLQPEVRAPTRRGGVGVECQGPSGSDGSAGARCRRSRCCGMTPGQRVRLARLLWSGTRK